MAALAAAGAVHLAALGGALFRAVAAPVAFDILGRASTPGMVAAHLFLLSIGV
jgi:hypothetical protein